MKRKGKQENEGERGTAWNLNGGCSPRPRGHLWLTPLQRNKLYFIKYTLISTTCYKKELDGACPGGKNSCAVSPYGG